MMRTITSLLDVELPVVQAPMAGVQDEALAIAVSAAGGLGSMPCALLDAAQLETALRRFASLKRPINLNFFCHDIAEPDSIEMQRWRQALEPYYREFSIELPASSTSGARRPIDSATVDLLEAFQPRIVSFHFGLPAPAMLERIKAWGAIVLASATTVAEGLWLQRRGADVVIAQGVEAGGHRGHFLSDDLTLQATTADLVASLSRSLTVPIIAAVASAAGATWRRCSAQGLPPYSRAPPICCAPRRGQHRCTARRFDNPADPEPSRISSAAGPHGGW